MVDPPRIDTDDKEQMSQISNPIEADELDKMSGLGTPLEEKKDLIEKSHDTASRVGRSRADNRRSRAASGAAGNVKSKKKLGGVTA